MTRRLNIRCDSAWDPLECHWNSQGHIHERGVSVGGSGAAVCQSPPPRPGAEAAARTGEGAACGRLRTKAVTVTGEERGSIGLATHSHMVGAGFSLLPTSV